MHKMQMYENLMDMLEREVKEVESKGELNQQSLDNLYKVLMSIKAADKRMETLGGQGMSQDGYRGNSNRMSYNSYDRSYDNSYARRGRDGDGDGRYSEDNFRDSSYRGRSYESYNSRDGAKQAMVQKLERLMDEPVSENDRLAIMDCINKIK